MHISYEKLWKLLIERHIKKTDLIELCGISSRTLTKLSKGENVNTDTLIRICDALECELCDIMELERAPKIYTFYESFIATRKLLSEDDFCKKYSFIWNNKQVILIQTIAKADKYVNILCKGSTVTWQKTYVYGLWGKENSYREISVADLFPADVIGVVVISGHPNMIQGLDENGFVSGVGIPKHTKSVYIMSEARFKIFTPKE